MTESEPHEGVTSRCANVLAAAQSGSIQGIICVCFLETGLVHVEIAGEQHMLTRLGALNVAGDCVKLVENQLAQQRAAQSTDWGPGGNA